ncbi:MAG: hypothetical protein ISN28_05415 [Ectothiorhodospiraceae bacterium AqS1]|nr:hypothetical protein [Ectothiorhodospiraceae bacterium AqS1]
MDKNKIALRWSKGMNEGISGASGGWRAGLSGGKNPVASTVGSGGFSAPHLEPALGDIRRHRERGGIR